MKAINKVNCIASCFIGLLWAHEGLSAPLSVGVNTLLQDTLPAKVAEIQAALKGSGVDMEFKPLPARRSLQSVRKGLIAIDLYRTPVAVNDYTEIIQIKPAVDIQDFWLVTGKKELCALSAAERQPYSIAGLRGARLFQSIYANFKSLVEVPSFTFVATMLTAGSVDFGVWTREGITEAQKRKNISLHICGDKPYQSFVFYTYIHKDYSWAIPQIEQSYRKVFGDKYQP